jgi:hypothetical protein
MKMEDAFVGNVGNAVAVVDQAVVDVQSSKVSETIVKTTIRSHLLNFRTVTRCNSQSYFFADHGKVYLSLRTLIGSLSGETQLHRGLGAWLLACTWWAPGSSSSTARQQGNDTLASTCFGVSNPSNPDVGRLLINLPVSSLPTDSTPTSEKKKTKKTKKQSAKFIIWLYFSL